MPPGANGLSGSRPTSAGRRNRVTRNARLTGSMRGPLAAPRTCPASSCRAASAATTDIATHGLRSGDPVQAGHLRSLRRSVREDRVAEAPRGSRPRRGLGLSSAVPDTEQEGAPRDSAWNSSSHDESRRPGEDPKAGRPDHREAATKSCRTDGARTLESVQAWLRRSVSGSGPTAPTAANRRGRMPRTDADSSGPETTSRGGCAAVRARIGPAADSGPSTSREGTRSRNGPSDRRASGGASACSGSWHGRKRLAR